MPPIRKTIEQIDQALPAVSTNLDLIVSNVQDVKEDLHNMRGDIQRSEEKLDHLPVIRERIDILPSSLASSIMLQLESQSRERHQFQPSGPGAAEIVDKIEALVCI
jgi:hypothetical protein